MARLPKRILSESASQTAGPYVHIGLTPNFAGIKKIYPLDLGKNIKPKTSPISIVGSVYDGAGELVRDCLLEFSQSGAKSSLGSRSKGSKHPIDFNRIPIDLETGSFALHTTKPAQTIYQEGGFQAPHITVWIVARGINLGLHTRIYFGDEEIANSTDPILSLVPKARRQTLIAKPIGKHKYEWNIHLQGKNETVFFDA